MARWIRHQSPEIQVTVFYIDIQTFGRDFPMVWDNLQEDIRFVRTVPGDAILTENSAIQVSFFDPVEGVAGNEDFDLLVLSVGITPGDTLDESAAILNLPVGENGFLGDPDQADPGTPGGITAAGTVFGPMSIVDTIKSAQSASWRTLRYLGIS
jgi:heterodisulfide reductase subunit A